MQNSYGSLANYFRQQSVKQWSHIHLLNPSKKDWKRSDRITKYYIRTRVTGYVKIKSALTAPSLAKHSEQQMRQSKGLSKNNLMQYKQQNLQMQCHQLIDVYKTSF